MTQLLLLLLWRYRCDFDIEKLQHSSLAPFPGLPPPPENPKSQTPNSPDTLLKITTETKWQTKDKSGRKTKLCFK